MPESKTLKSINDYLSSVNYVLSPEQVREILTIVDNIINGVGMTGRYEAFLSRIPTTEEHDVIKSVLILQNLTVVGPYVEKPGTGIILIVSDQSRESLLRMLGGQPVTKV